MAASIDDLPNELLESCFQYLHSVRDKAALLSVSHRFRMVGASAALWRCHDLSQPRWVPLPLARALVSVNPQGLRLCVVLIAWSDLTMEVAAACEALRVIGDVTDSKAERHITYRDWEDEAFLRGDMIENRHSFSVDDVVALLRRMPLRHIQVDADAVCLILLDNSAIFESVEHFTAPSTVGSDLSLSLLSDVTRAMPRLRTLRYWRIHKDDDWEWDFDALLCPALTDLLDISVDEEAVEAFQIFVRACCPGLTSLSVDSNVDLNEIWPTHGTAMSPVRTLELRDSRVRGVDAIDCRLPFLETLIIRDWDGKRILYIFDGSETPRLRTLRLSPQQDYVSARILSNFLTLAGDDGKPLPTQLERIEFSGTAYPTSPFEQSIASALSNAHAHWAGQLPDIVPVLDATLAVVQRSDPGSMVLVWTCEARAGSWKVKVDMTLSMTATRGRGVSLEEMNEDDAVIARLGVDVVLTRAVEVSRDERVYT